MRVDPNHLTRSGYLSRVKTQAAERVRKAQEATEEDNPGLAVRAENQQALIAGTLGREAERLKVETHIRDTRRGLGQLSMSTRRRVEGQHQSSLKRLSNEADLSGGYLSTMAGLRPEDRLRFANRMAHITEDAERIKSAPAEAERIAERYRQMYESGKADGAPDGEET